MHKIFRFGVYKSQKVWSSNHTELQGIQGVQGALGTGSGRFKHSEPHQTFSTYKLTELTSFNLIKLHPHRASKVYSHMSSGWFAWIEPSQAVSLQGIEGVRVLCALVT